MSSWPTGVPETLWNDAALQIRALPAIPMMGVEVSPNFLIAFAVGAAFVCYTGWVRFRQRRIEDDSEPYRVMKIDIAELGGAAAMRRASIIYTTTLMALYVAVTFFGKLIVQSINALNVVGIQVDAAALQFDDPQWPLMLALGFAGLAPLVPWLLSAEAYLFRRAYRAVGIPVRIQQTTRNLLVLLGGGHAKARGLYKDIEKRRDALAERARDTWLTEPTISRIKRDFALTELAELEVLSELTGPKRGTWPGSSVSPKVRDLEKEIVEEGRELRDRFEKTFDSYPAPQRREAYLREVGDKAAVLTKDLVAVLAVYVERDPDFSVESGMEDKVTDAGLRAVLEEADPPNLAGSGPEVGVLIYIALSFVVYAIFMWKGQHSLIDSRWDPNNFVPVLASAGVEALRLLSIFWFPLVAAFGLRQHFCDAGTWVDKRSKNPSVFMEQRLLALVLGFCLSALCLAGVAALATLFMARDATAFRANLLYVSIPYILYYPAMAFLSAPVVWFSLAGADLRARGLRKKRDGARVNTIALWTRAALCAALVVAMQALHIVLMEGGNSCLAPGTFPFNMFQEDCFLGYGGLDYLTMPLLALLAVAVFGRPHPAPVKRPGEKGTGSRASGGSTPDPSPDAPPAPEPGSRSAPLPVAGRKARKPPKTVPAAPLILLALLVAALWASRVHAQDVQGRRGDVTIGFRVDAEPFSYRITDPVPQNGRLYRGYLADLCYWIFDGSGYDVKEKAVSVGDRFRQLKEGEIDVLCDPVTLRYSEEMEPGVSRAMAGTFSPIVFATGVTYLRRTGNSPYMRTYVGYVSGSTAEGVAEQVCRNDLFGVIAADERDQLEQMCRTAGVARDLEALPRTALIKEPLRERVEAAATYELAFATEQRDKAGAVRKRTLEGLVAKWTEAVAALKTCGSSCTAERFQLWFDSACEDPQTPPEPGTWAPTVYRFCAKDSHSQLIAWFCREATNSPALVYLGDRELILGKLRTWERRHDVGCTVVGQTGAIDLSYEPYALMTAHPNLELPADMDDEDREQALENARRLVDITRLVQQRVYEFFSFSSLARAKFDVYFEGYRNQMSHPLAYLFALNAVERESSATTPIEEPPVVDPVPTWKGVAQSIETTAARQDAEALAR